MKQIYPICLIFATLFIGCAGSSTSKDQSTPKRDTIVIAAPEVSATIPAEAPQIESGEVFDLVVGTYAGSTEPAIKELRLKGFSNAFAVPITDDKGKRMNRVIAERARNNADALRIKASLERQGVQAWIWKHQAGSSDVIASKPAKRIRINVVNLDGYEERVWRGTMGKKAVTMVLNGNDWSGLNGGYFFYNSAPKKYYALKMRHHSKLEPEFFQTIDMGFDAYLLDGTKIGEFNGTLNIYVAGAATQEYHFTGTFLEIKTGKMSNVDVLGAECV